MVMALRRKLPPYEAHTVRRRRCRTAHGHLLRRFPSFTGRFLSLCSQKGCGLPPGRTTFVGYSEDLMKLSRFAALFVSLFCFTLPCFAGSARPPLVVTQMKQLPDGSTVFKLAGGGTVVYKKGADPTGFENLVGSSQRVHVPTEQGIIQPWEGPQTPRLSNGMIGWQNPDGTYTKFGCGDPVAWLPGPRPVLKDGAILHFFISRAPPTGKCP